MGKKSCDDVLKVQMDALKNTGGAGDE
jgi:hypothetical protein